MFHTKEICMITDLKIFCQLFYAATAIPVTYYQISTNTCCSFPSILEDASLFRKKLPGFLHFTKNPDFFTSQSFAFYGYIKSAKEDNAIIVGPLFSTALSKSTLHSFMQEWGISLNYRAEIEQLLTGIPQISYHQFLKILTYLHFCLNDEYLDAAQHFHQEDTNSNNAFSNLHSHQVIEAKESRRFHNTYYFEQGLIQYIQNGEVEKLELLLKTSSELSEGILADNSLRQAKNIFITSTTLATRSAIAGGMDMEQAYLLSDAYIQECEKSQVISNISTLTYTMLMDFAKRVSQNKMPQGMSLEVFDCLQFISHHINEPLQVGDVAEHIGRSRSYLAKKFKQELGFDVSNFIMRCKLEEAKSLLTYSNKTLSEISSYLCFSSQSYFQNVFKKKYGVTPTQYRKNTLKIN